MQDTASDTSKSVEPSDGQIPHESYRESASATLSAEGMSAMQGSDEYEQPDTGFDSASETVTPPDAGNGDLSPDLTSPEPAAPAADNASQNQESAVDDSSSPPIASDSYQEQTEPTLDDQIASAEKAKAQALDEAYAALKTGDREQTDEAMNKVKESSDLVDQLHLKQLEEKQKFIDAERARLAEEAAAAPRESSDANLQQDSNYPFPPRHAVTEQGLTGLIESGPEAPEKEIWGGKVKMRK